MVTDIEHFWPVLYKVQMKDVIDERYLLNDHVNTKGMPNEELKGNETS